MDSLADVDTLSEVIPTCPNCRKEDRGSNEYARWSNLTASKDLRFVTDVIDDKGFSLEAGERQQDLELRQIFFRVDSAFDNVNELRGAMDRLERYQEERERRDPTVNSDCLGSLDRGMYLLWHGFGGVSNLVSPLLRLYNVDWG